MQNWLHYTFQRKYMKNSFLGRFRRNIIPIALTLMVRLPENFIIVSLIMAPRPQNQPPFKSLYIYVCIVCGCAAGRIVQPIVIKFGTKFRLDVTKNWLVFGDFSPKGVEMVGGGWNLKKFITTLIWMILVWLQMVNILLINPYNFCLKSFLIGAV